jgi:hypothetical protein
MRIAAGLAGLAVLAGCVAQVGEDGGLRTTAVIAPVGIAVVPVYVPQPAPAPVVRPARPAQVGSIRP